LLKKISWEDLKKFRIVDLIIGLAQEEPIHRKIYDNFLRINFLNGTSDYIAARIAVHAVVYLQRSHI
jgi:hypothetical protein